MTLLVRLAETSEAIAATSSRKEKSERLADTIRELEPDEIVPAIGFLTGSARQGRVGIGWASLQRVVDQASVVASEPSITIAEFDQLISDIAETTGSGSEQARVDLIVATIDRATATERPFMTSVLLGELRQGALAGVVTDAVAKAAGLKIATLRRAVMLSGDLGFAAYVALTDGADGLEAIDLEAGRPIQPMLASTAADVTEALDATGEASVEWKLDGARIQVHKTTDGSKPHSTTDTHTAAGTHTSTAAEAGTSTAAGTDTGTATEPSTSTTAGTDTGTATEPDTRTAADTHTSTAADTHTSTAAEPGTSTAVDTDTATVRIFTRNLNDVTDRLPGVVALVRGFDCTSTVLDGEVLGMIEVDGDVSPQAFQDTMSRLGSDGPDVNQRDAASPELVQPDNNSPDLAASPNLAAGPDLGEPGGGDRSDTDTATPDTATTDDSVTSSFSMRPFFFDIMELDGVSLIDAPLAQRRAHLEQLTGQFAVPATTTDDASVAQAQLDNALNEGHEGVMVKAVDGAYEAGRRGKSWRKVKPVHTLDLVVLAAEWGHGRRKGWLSNLHLGARDATTGELVMVGKTFKGLTDKLLAWQTEQFLERRLDPEAKGHTVEIRRDMVVEIAVDGAQGSTRYPGGVALRFARVRGYRPDRTPDTADTLDAVRSLLPGARKTPGKDTP